MTKRITAIIAALVLLCSTVATTAYADIDRSYLTDVFFESEWNSEYKGDYYHFTQSTVKIEHNPIAAMYYMTMEAFISSCDEKMLQMIVDGKENPRNFMRLYFDDWDYESTKKKNLYYGDSLLYGVEFGISGYQYGIWELIDINDNTIYGRFVEDDATFTLIDNDTNEVLGVYKKLIGYEYLDKSSSGDSGNGTGGSGSANGGSNTNSSYSENSVSTNNNSSENNEKTIGSPYVSSNSDKDDEADTRSTPARYNSVYDTDNPAVTPEIVSAVDAAKASGSDSNNEDIHYTTSSQNKEGNSVINFVVPVIVIVVIAVIALYMIVQKKRKDENNANNTNKI